MGDVPARDAVFSAFARSLIKFKARQLAKKPGYTRSDEEDLAQELTLHLLGRAHLFDPSRASVNTFADRVIQSGIAMMLRDRRRQKRGGGQASQSLEHTSAASENEQASLRDALSESDGSRRTGNQETEAERAETVAAVVEAFQSLPPELQDVCRRLIDGSAASAASEMGVSRRQIRKALAIIRKHFETSGFGNH